MAVAILAVVLALVLALGGGLSLLVGGGPTPSGAARTDQPEGFPTEVFGMPVVTIADALTLIDAGKVDGRALAIGGWWVQPMVASCPAPMRWMAELEAYCVRNIFSSRGFSAVTCTQFGDRAECNSNQPPAGAAVMAPITVNETSGLAAMVGATSAPLWRDSGAPAVVVGHAGDPRLWHCPVETREECRRQFVIDRVAWVAGESVDLAPAEQRIPTVMTPPEAAALAGAEDALTALPVLAANAPTVDPRLHFVGDPVLWIVRTLSPTNGVAAEDPTREVDVAVIDDATIRLLQQTKLKLAVGSEPALLLVQATQLGECCAGNMFPSYRVELPDGTGVQEMNVSGWSGGGEGNLTRHGAGAPVVLEPGEYVIRVWRSFVQNGASGPPRDKCETHVSLVGSEELRVQAAFPAGACEFVDPTFVEVFDR